MAVRVEPEPTGGVPAPPADPRAATRGLSSWLDRVVAVLCLSSFVPILALAQPQLASMHLGWLIVVGGTLIGTRILMPVYAWSDRGMKVPAAIYALAVLDGLVSWPLGWAASTPPDGPPWLWLCIVIAAACAGAVFGHRVAIPYLITCVLVYLLVRMSPSGGSATPMETLHDAFLVVAQPAAVMIWLHLAKRAVAALDDSLDLASRSGGEAAVQEALVAERGRLDAIVHDEVMTTLVAAARPGSDREALATQANAAIDSLRSADSGPADESPIAPSQFVQLIRDVVAAAAPAATVVADVSAEAGLVPNAVVTAITRATREACLNAGKHARADTITVEVSATGSGQGTTITVRVTDDGIGFDPAAVPWERLGLRISIRKRMQRHHGEATVDSAPGEGTRVTLTWTGDRATFVPNASTVGGDWVHPALTQRLLTAVGFALGLLTVAYLCVGVLTVPAFQYPWLVMLGIVAILMAMTLGLSRFGKPMSLGRSGLIVGLVLLAAVLTTQAIAAGNWPGNIVWFLGCASLMFVTVRAGGQRILAWTAAVAFGAVFVVHVISLDGRSVLGEAVITQAVAAFAAPMIWLGTAEFFMGWLGRLVVELTTAAASTREAAEARAASYSRLVLREVWLADLRDLVGDLIIKIADPSQPLTDDDRDTCLALEGTLRDGIRAVNLTSPALAEAIVDARRRGVSITLVDNRGSALPDHVRRATLRHMESVVPSLQAGRLVARTAPEGYDEAVTIVAVTGEGATTMTTIGHDGTIAERT